MPIQNEEEFEKVVNVSWYKPEQPVTQMKYVFLGPTKDITLTFQISLRIALLANVSAVLYRHSQFPKPNIFFYK